jgi:hypothetical protein
MGGSCAALATMVERTRRQWSHRRSSRVPRVCRPMRAMQSAQRSLPGRCAVHHTGSGESDRCGQAPSCPAAARCTNRASTAAAGPVGVCWATVPRTWAARAAVICAPWRAAASAWSSSAVRSGRGVMATALCIASAGWRGSPGLGVRSARGRACGAGVSRRACREVLCSGGRRRRGAWAAARRRPPGAGTASRHLQSGEVVPATAQHAVITCEH